MCCCKRLHHLAMRGAARNSAWGLRGRIMGGESWISDGVQILATAFDRDKGSAYRDADVFVLPSQNENFGNTAGEAVAAGTPVVVTDKCGIAPLLADVAGPGV